MTSASRGAGRWVALVWIAIIVALLAMAVVAVVLPEMPAFPRLAVLLFSAQVTSLGVVGAFLISRQPRNVVGWLLWSSAMGIALAVAGDAVAFNVGPGASGTPTAWFVWLSSLTLIPSFVTVAILVPLFFPDGRLLSPRWRWLVLFTGIALVAGLAPRALTPGLIPDTRIANPAAIPLGADIWFLDTFGNTLAPLIAFPLAVASMVLRYRRGSSIQRQQLKWFGAAAAVTVGLFFLAIAAPQPFGDIGWVGAIVSITLVPLAIGIAVLRYRLYEIDRIISRTVGWTIVTGALVAAFAVLVVGLSGALATFAQGQTVAVAAATLLVFALFQPVRRRVQRAVDRRFDRARFDAERTAAAFSTRIRDEVDMATLTGDLAFTTQTALAPAALAVWIRNP